MEILDIIKEAFMFPSNDIGKLAIYIVLTLVTGFLAMGGAFSVIGSVIGDAGGLSIVGIILFIAAFILGFILSGYQIGIIKSGIDSAESAPDFDWAANLVTGIKNLVVNIVYFIIPAIITGIIALLTGVPQNMANIVQEVALNSVNATATGNSTLAVSSIPAPLISNLISSLAITATIGFILVIFFAFLHTMGQSRLANTDSLAQAINIPEAFKDIGRIGWGKVIATVLLVAIIIAVINVIISVISSRVPAIGILSLIITPYLIFFAARATGLLYSEIA